MKGRKPSLIHVFNYEGEKIDSLTSDKLREKYRISVGAFQTSLQRGSLNRKSGLYFSKKETFIPPKNKLNHNPLIAYGIQNNQKNLDEFYTEIQ